MVALMGITAFAVIIRVLILPYSSVDGSNGPARVWIAWEWLSDPEIITHGVWGPLHFYLIGIAMALVEDPIYSPIILHIVIAVFTPILVFVFTKNEFGSQRAALVVAATYALYPIAVRNSVQARAEVPFVFFILLSMIFVSFARRKDGQWKHVIAAGISLTLACMLRYEGWMLIPLIGVLLWRKPQFMIAFASVAMIHPVMWMIGNAVHFDDPLYPITFASNWELGAMGKGQYSFEFSSIMQRAMIFPKKILIGVTVLLGLVCVLGAVLALLKHERGVIWLIPLLGLLCLMSLAVVRGSLVPKFNYTASLGTMLFPFSAVVYKHMGIDAWSKMRGLGLSFSMMVSIGVFTCWVCLKNIGLGDYVMNPIPTIPNQTTVLSLVPVVRDNMETDRDGFISDFYGWGPQVYVPYLAGLPRHRIFLAPGAPNVSLNENELSMFLQDFPDGILIALTGSRFANAIGLKGEQSIHIGKKLLSIRKIHSIIWPKPRTTAKVEVAKPRLEIYRYDIVVE